MDVTAMLNTASTAAAMERNLQMPHERKDSSDDELVDAIPTPSATMGGSTAPSSMAATPLEKTPSRRSSDSRTPNKNRTPWDAGGYSLSLALDDTKKFIQTSTGTQSAFVVGGTSPIPKDILSASAATPTASSVPAAAAVSAQGSITTSESCGGSMDLTGGSTSPRHKFSDSRSSFSSAYTNASSTNNSVAHSRISSLSTVSENQPLATLITDFSLLETRISEPRMGLGLGHAHHASSNQHQLKLQQYSFATTQFSPSREDGRHDANVQPESPTPVRPRHDMSMGASPEPSPRSPGRVQSPSDAMLIHRPGHPGEADEVLYFPNPSRLQIPSSHLRSQSRGDLLQSNSSPTRRHKRAASAPDFPSIGNSSFNPRFPTFGPIPEPTPSPSQHSDGIGMEDSSSSSPTGAHGPSSPPSGQVFSSDPFQFSTPASKMTGTSSSSPRNMSPPGLTPVGHLSHVSSGSISDQTPGSQSVATPGSGPTGEFDADPVCMYRGDCQTGSQLRKAISHIFGRNKLCTRMIPTGVWVHYCRKHYQRTRYRNGNEYPQRQIGLVQVQVQRVQSWSDSNVRQNRGPVLKDWSLSVRKREQLRLDSKMTSGTKKRPFYDDGNEGEENFGEKRSETSSTAVPTWLVTMIKDGYSTPQILGIVTRLKDDIDSGRLQQIPDIEILPNIVTDSNNDEPAANNSVKKTYTKRRTTVAPGVGPVNHRRSQSVNTSMLRYDSAPMARRSSQPNNYMAPTAHQFANDYDQLPMEKRQRVDSEGMGMGQHQHHRHQHHHSMSGIPDRYESPMASRTSFGGRVQLAHRPAFAGIRESLAEGHTGGYYPEERGYDNGPDSAFAARESYARQNSGYGIDRRFSAVGGPESQIPLAHGFDAHRDHERDHERHHSTSSAGPNNEPAYGVLPAPNPQRFGGPSVAQQLESSSYVLNSAASRRTGAHQRSVSEAGFLHQAPPPSSFYGRPTSSSSHAAPQLNNLPRLSTNFSEEEPRPSAFSSYQQHQTYGSLGANPATHHAHHAPRSLGHGHSHSMSHTHHHSYNSSNQYNRYNTPSRFGADERRGSLSSQPQQPAALNPSVTSSSTTGNMEKFDNIQLPPLQCVVQTTPSPPQMTVPPAAPALDSSAPSAHLNTGEGIAVQGHSRHQSTSSVAYILGPTVEPGSTSPYVSPPSHATSSSTQNAN